MDVMVTYDSEWLDKGEYQSTVNINSNDLTDPVLWSHHTMRVTGTPEFYVYGGSDSSGMDMDFGQIHFLLGLQKNLMNFVKCIKILNYLFGVKQE